MSPAKGPRGVSAAERKRAAELAAAEERRRKQFVWTLVAVLLAAALLVGGAVGWNLYQSRRTPSAAPGQADPNGPQVPQAGQPLRIGKSDARHVVTVWEDIHCPHCATLEDRIGPTLTAAVRDGRARLELYPMQIIDAGSGRAAAALGCAAEQGMALSFHSALWENPRLVWDNEQLASVGKASGGDKGEAIARCIADGRHVAWAASLESAGQAAGIEGTPTVSVDGTSMDVGKLDAAALEAALR